MQQEDRNWRQYLDFSGRLADAAAAVTVARFRTPMRVANKAATGQPLDPVTAADRDSERVMRALIHECYPDHGILGEEQPPEPGAGAGTWVLDPIDGTRSFISGIPLWGTLIAYNDGTRPLVGIMDQPVLGERYSGTPGGAWMNGRALSVRPCATLGEAILFTADPDMFTGAGERAAYRRLEGAVGLRRFGADCYAYCMLARGCIDLVVEGDMKPYDIQALIPIVEGAGGVVTTWDGGPADDGGLLVAAGDRRVHAAALEILAPR